MPLADAVVRTSCRCPTTPGPRVRAGVRLAGACTAFEGTRVPTGSVGVSPAADAWEPVVARPAVQAADSTASGSNADAFCARPNPTIDLPPPGAALKELAAYGPRFRAGPTWWQVHGETASP